MIRITAFGVVQAAVRRSLPSVPVSRPFTQSSLNVLSGLPSARCSDIKKIGRADLIDVKVFDSHRRDLAKKFKIPLKELRRVHLGPSASVLFTNYDLIWFQIQEMLRIEKGGDEQIKDELAAYKDLIPQGGELVGCLMYEIDNPVKRKQFLEKMTGSEFDTTITFGDQTVQGRPIRDDIDRTHPSDGRTSAVHFLRWSFTPEQAAKLRAHKGSVVLGMSNRLYPHQTVLSDALLAALLGDLAV